MAGFKCTVLHAMLMVLPTEQLEKSGDGLYDFVALLLSHFKLSHSGRVHLCFMHCS